MLHPYTILYYDYQLNDNHRFQQEASKWQDEEAQGAPHATQLGELSGEPGAGLDVEL